MCVGQTNKATTNNGISNNNNGKAKL
jgi:hypothetical protein